MTYDTDSRLISRSHKKISFSHSHEQTQALHTSRSAPFLDFLQMEGTSL